MKVSVWHNCYDNQWRGLIVPDAFSHPAKFSPGLIQKIYAYGIERGYFKPGDLIGDPFLGVGGGGIYAAYAKLRHIGVELEEKFVDLTKQNYELHRPTWEAHGYPFPLVMQGDSRRFSEIVGQCEAILTSPSYAEGGGHGSLNPNRDIYTARKLTVPCDHYGTEKGQIGKLKAGDLKAIVTSPPYADSINQSNGANDSKERIKRKAAAGIDISHKPNMGGPNSCLNRDQVYGDNLANIGKLSAVVTSPPWEDREGAHSAKKYKDPEKIAETMSQSYRDGTFKGHYASKEAILKGLERENDWNYGESPGQIGKEQAETYWTAMQAVYSECFKALKPGGYLIVVLKSYVKNKRRVHLPMQTLKLLIHTGFEPIERIKAMLVKESVNSGLFGEDVVSRKSRKSFFRRLHEKRFPNLKIDFEEVLVCQRPNNI